METIIFANGETHAGDLNAYNGKAYVALSDMDFIHAAQILGNPAMIGDITCGRQHLIDYNQCIMLTVQPYGFEGCLIGGREELLPEQPETNENHVEEVTPDDD